MIASEINQMFMKFLNELNALGLVNGQYAIFGSGPMSVRGIREIKDIDLVVKKALWKNLVIKYPDNLRSDPTCLKIGNLEIYRDWPGLSDRIDEMIDSADIIAGFPFVQLSYVVEWKKNFGRKKDIEDIELIKKFNITEKQARRAGDKKQIIV